MSTFPSRATPAFGAPARGMRKTLLGAGLGLMGLMAAGGAALAHHGWGSYDSTKGFTMTGKVATLDWSNPHAHLTMTHAGATWEAILAPLSRMQARGLTREMISGASEVSVFGYPSTKTQNEMRAERIIISGTTYELR